MTWCSAPLRRCDARARVASMGVTSRTARARALAALAALVLGACDFPTEPPKFQTRFVVPGENTTLSVNQLLPSSITVVGSNFRLSIGGQAIPSRTLGQMCGTACDAFPTVFTAPKPAFIDSIPVTLNLPADVSGATLAGGSVTVSLIHTFGFDPLRPPGGANGSLTLRVRNGTNVLGTLTITDPFPPNTQLTRTLQLTPGAIAGPLVVTVVLNSPAGSATQPVVIDKNASLTGSVTPDAIDISSAIVAVSNKQVSVQAVAIDLTGFEDLRDRVKGGAIVINMTNPLNVTGAMTATLTGGTSGPISKPVTVAAGTTTQRIQFTEAELRSMLGRELQLTISGPVSGPNGFATVSPGLVISISTLLDFTFEIGAGDNT